MYADRVSAAMEEAITETERRRAIQEDYNREHGITPVTIRKAIQEILVRKQEEKHRNEELSVNVLKQGYNLLIPQQRRAPMSKGSRR
jgi:excinuclease ABC subunit B